MIELEGQIQCISLTKLRESMSLNLSKSISQELFEAA